MTLNMSHTWVGDMDINLVAPNNQILNLVGGLNGGTGNNGTANFTNTAFSSLGAAVTERSSPWRLGVDDAPLTAAWLDGWIGAAVEQEPALASGARDYVRMRRAQSEAGNLSVKVDHHDILVMPR